jgi:hypothetical protein
LVKVEGHLGCINSCFVIDEGVGFHVKEDFESCQGSFFAGRLCDLMVSYGLIIIHVKVALVGL